VLDEPPTPGLVRPSEGCQQPATAVCGWFTEVFETRDLKDAKGPLEELASNHFLFLAHRGTASLQANKGLVRTPTG
jgi:hypothetical protein